MFAVDDIHDTAARPAAHGAETPRRGGTVREHLLLGYLRGPAGIIVALAEQIG